MLYGQWRNFHPKMALGVPIFVLWAMFAGKLRCSPTAQNSCCHPFLLFTINFNNTISIVQSRELWSISLHQLNLETKTLEIFGKQRANKATVNRVILIWKNNFCRHGGPLARGPHAMTYLAYRLIRHLACLGLTDSICVSVFKNKLYIYRRLSQRCG